MDVMLESRIVSPDEQIATPALVVDLDLLRQNIAEMQQVANEFGVNLRPHAKTHKTPIIATMQIEAGSVGLSCAKLGEAEVFVEEMGVQDVFIAYPIVGEDKIARLLALARRTHITCAVDNLAAAESISRAAATADMTIDVYLEVDTGMHRAGVPAGDEAVALGQAIAALPGVRLTGVMTFEGHAGVSPPATIAAVSRAAGEAVVATANRLRSLGIPIEHVSVGSTPAAWHTPGTPGVTEMRPGTYVFHDNNAFQHGRIGPDRCAARVLATVVSRPAPDRAVVDAGAKALALDPSLSHPGYGYIAGHPQAILARLSEEHGVVMLPEGESGFEVGDRVEIIPNHICPAVNLMDDLAIVQNGRLVDRWPIAARGMVR